MTDADGTVHRLWRVADPQAIAAVQAATRDAELLIADGHHRYETMQAYAEEVGGEGEHRYILMCLVALEDPGLTVFPTHRLVSGLDDAAPRGAARRRCERDFEIERGAARADRPRARHGTAGARLLRLARRRAYRLTLKDQAIADAALPGHSERLPRARHGRARGAAC